MIATGKNMEVLWIEHFMTGVLRTEAKNDAKRTTQNQIEIIGAGRFL